MKLLLPLLFCLGTQEGAVAPLPVELSARDSNVRLVGATHTGEDLRAQIVTHPDATADFIALRHTEGNALVKHEHLRGRHHDKLDGAIDQRRGAETHT